MLVYPKAICQALVAASSLITWKIRCQNLIKIISCRLYIMVDFRNLELNIHKEFYIIDSGYQYQLKNVSKYGGT